MAIFQMATCFNLSNSSISPDVIICRYAVHLSLSSTGSNIAPFQWLSPQELAEERAKTVALRLALQQRGLTGHRA